MKVTGASLNDPITWHRINWNKVNRNVRRLQVRIVKAWQEGKKGKVRALQNILTRSFGGRALAVKRVTENQGKRTAGVDKVLWQTPCQKANAIQRLKAKGYRAQPLRRVYIAKSKTKKRPLGIPTMRDRAMQALYKLALEPIAECTADPNSYGFRVGRSTADAIQQVFNCLKHPNAASYILKADIKGCFDHISHQWLLENIPMDKKILKQWLQAGVIEQGSFRATKAGTPQGGIISPLLANMALDGLEEVGKASFSTKRGKQERLHCLRYADDAIHTAKDRQVLEREVKPLMEQHLQKRGLQLSAQKTQIVHINQGFDYLGFNVRKYKKGKLLIKPAKENFKKFLAKIKQTIKQNRQATAAHLIYILNPIIRGWANYYRHVVSKQFFNRADYEINGMLWRWAKRRHRRKPKDWIKNKYFRRNEQGRDWCFFGHKDDREVYLFRMMTVPITRHVKIVGLANPFDPQWEPYFEKRMDDQMSKTFEGRKKVLRLWQQQAGKCPVCKQFITDQTGWNNHHIIWKVHGGRDTLDNRILLHPNCHRQVHSQGLKVAKLRPP